MILRCLLENLLNLGFFDLGLFGLGFWEVRVKHGVVVLIVIWKWKIEVD
jgi:hypothetical protein